MTDEGQCELLARGLLLQFPPEKVTNLQTSYRSLEHERCKVLKIAQHRSVGQAHAKNFAYEKKEMKNKSCILLLHFSAAHIYFFRLVML